MPRVHRYAVTVRWTGNSGSGTSSYSVYSREHEIAADGKPLISGSSDPAFRGDATRWNPEELFVASLAACHKLWYLHLCADAGIIVLGYEDHAEGEMEETGKGGGRFLSVTLHPQVTVAPGTDPDRARALHDMARLKCFLANSVNCALRHEAEVSVQTR